MARVDSARVEALVQHCHHSDSDVEFVSHGTDTQLQFNPLGDAVAQFLCKRLEVRRKGMSVTAARGLGAPCKIVEILGDGNCFFRAISEAVCGTDEYHGTIRHAVVKQLESHAAAYESILRTGYGSVSEYIRESNMRSQSSWATEVEIQAAADLLGVSIYTYYIDRWIEYSCKGVQVSDQGIYLENRGNHYKTVVCVKRPQMQSCYEYCKVDTSGNNVTREFSSLPVESADHVSNTDLAEEDHESNENLAEEDYESNEDPTEEGAGQRQQMRENLSWSVLNTSWGTFLEWLRERWWGQVSEYEISSFMDKPKRRAGDIVVAAPFGNTPGAVCSITVKTEDSTLTTDLVICGGFYTCTKLLDGEFSDPIKVIRHLVRKMKYVHLQPRPMTIPSNPTKDFSAKHVAEQLCLMMKLLPRTFWGTYESAELSLRYRKTMQHLQMRRRQGGEMFANPVAIMHCTTDVCLGYLFEVINDQGKKIKVTFDRFGFTIGNGSHFYEITSLLAYINKVAQVTFLRLPDLGTL